MSSALKLRVKSLLGLESSSSAQEAVAPPKKVEPIYRQWIPPELPDEYSDMTPTWLYYKLHYEVAAQKVFGLKANNVHEALKIGLTIAVIGIVLVFGIVVMSYGTSGG